MVLSIFFSHFFWHYDEKYITDEKELSPWWIPFKGRAHHSGFPLCERISLRTHPSYICWFNPWKIKIKISYIFFSYLFSFLFWVSDLNSVRMQSTLQKNITKDLLLFNNFASSWMNTIVHREEALIKWEEQPLENIFHILFIYPQHSSL